MDAYLTEFYQGIWVPFLFAIIFLQLLALGKCADWLVQHAVSLSLRSGLPKVVIGATVVSLGTTAPEAAVSVYAAITGEPGLALGNAVGSVICDTGLILGLAACLRPLPLDRSIVNGQGWLQVGAGFLLVISCWNWSHPGQVLEKGGNLPQFMGFVFCALLVGYLWLSVRWARQHRSFGVEAELEDEDTKQPGSVVVLLLIGSVALVVFISTLLKPGIVVAAEAVGVPGSIVAASIVALGTSLPELVTAVTATLRGHGELAVGNVIGADILNVLFVAGLSAAVTRDGLTAEPHFFQLLFPAMLVILIVFRVGIWRGKTSLRRPFGVVLLVLYGVFLALLIGMGLVPDPNH